jgi:hypothetical protein
MVLDVRRSVVLSGKLFAGVFGFCGHRYSCGSISRA